MKTLLCIDDEKCMLDCYRTALSHLGINCITAASADEGIAALKEHPEVDLVTLDIKMPEKNGFDAYQEIREFSAVPVLFATAYPASFTTDSTQLVNMWVNQFADGNTDILYKPFDFDALLEKIEGLLGPVDSQDGDPTE